MSILVILSGIIVLLFFFNVPNLVMDWLEKREKNR